MDKIKLRAHHIDILLSYMRNKGWTKFHDKVVSSIYSPRFARDMKKLFSQVSHNTLVEVVSGLDDLCKKAVCPYQSLCSNPNNYKKLIKKMLGRAPKQLRGDLTSFFNRPIPDLDDSDVLKSYHLKLDETYTLDDLERREHQHFF